MIFFSIFFTFLKIFLSLFINILITSVNLKIIGIIVFHYITWYLITYRNRQNRKLSNLRKWKRRFPDSYKFNSTKDHITNIVFLIGYSSIFIIGILWLRFYFITREIDLNFYYYKLLLYIENVTRLDIAITAILFMYIFFVYTIIVMKSVKLFRFHILKRHFYLAHNFKYCNFYRYVLNYTVMFQIIDICEMYYRLMHLKAHDISQNFHSNCRKVPYILHHIILIIVILYDILFNDMILKHIYYILPFIFIYHMWIKLTQFLENLNILYDYTIHNMIYYKVNKHLDYYVFDDPHQSILAKEELRSIFLYYILKDFIYDKESENNENKLYYQIIRKKPIIAKRIYYKLNKLKMKLKHIFIEPLK